MGSIPVLPSFSDWEVIRPLGEGGQSKVEVVRSPKRSTERAVCLAAIRSALDGDKRAELAEAIWTYARPDLPSELGARKVFKIPPMSSKSPHPSVPEHLEALERLKNEIKVLSQNRPGLPKLLDSDEDGRWIVTELFPEGTLERHFSKYKGKAVLALRAFRSLVATVAALHKDNYVHRDIKPENIFVRGDEELVLGDFGIVHMPSRVERLTITNERVGPRDYMPQWADLGERLEHVHPNFDVYMLGKLLWCMIAGRMKLPREYYRRPLYDLAVIFPENEDMHRINSILDRCLVEEPGDCLASAQQLLELVEETLAYSDRRGPLLDKAGHLRIPCRVCGKGYYQPYPVAETLFLQRQDDQGRSLSALLVQAHFCNVCTHLEIFLPGNPEDALKRGWSRWL